MKKMKILLISMLIITAVYLGVIVYANSNSSSGGAIDAAFLYHGEPEEWYTPEQLGIVKICGYSEDANWIQVVYGDQGSLVNPDEQPIFKYNGKFWQISKLHVTPGLPEEAKKWQVPIGGMIAVGWVFTGIVFFKSKRRAIAVSLSLLIFFLSFPSFPVTSATTTSRDLRAFPALPEEVCEAEPIPENSTVEYLNTTNPSNSVSPMGEESESEGNNPLYVLVFGDEEEEQQLRLRPTRIGQEWLTWNQWALFQLERGDNALASTFGIDIRILDFLTWDSDNSKDSMYDLWDELATETGSYLGQWYEGEWWSNHVDAIIGITDQETPADYHPIAGLTSGPLEIDKGNIFVLLKWQVYWADDNLVQHEVSHLFYADDEYPYCGVMACHTHYQTFIWEDALWPVFADVLCAYTSYDWDTYNKDIINLYKDSYCDDEYAGMLVIRHGPLVFPFNYRGTVDFGAGYGVYADIGGRNYEISIESVKPGYKFDYWLIDGTTKIYSETMNVYVPSEGKVRLAAYFKKISSSHRHHGGGGGRWLLYM